MKRQCPRYPQKRRYSRPQAVQAALEMGKRGVRHVKVYYCTGCHGHHVGRDWQTIKLEGRRA